MLPQIADSVLFSLISRGLQSKSGSAVSYEVVWFVSVSDWPLQERRTRTSHTMNHTVYTR